MNKQEQEFKQSILNKIKDYEIEKNKGVPVTFNECLQHAQNKFVNTIYYDKSSELVDIGIEKYLCQLSPCYFISKYCSFTLPGKGELSGSNLYYYQKEILKDFMYWKKVVLTKSRQCLTEDAFVRTNRGIISIKDIKIGDKIETIQEGKKVFTEVLDFIPQGEKEVCQITTNFGDIITSTLDHKYLTKEGWKEAKDLTLKDELISLKEKDSFGDFSFDNDLKPALIGYYLADKKSILPEELMNLNKRQMSIMLNRLFCGNGWCSVRKRKEAFNTYTYEIGLGIPNQQFLKQIEYILKAKYGIGCKVQEQKNSFWKLRIQRRKDVKKFINEIGVYKKDEKIKKYLLEDKENTYISHQSDFKIEKIAFLNEKQPVYDITTGTHDFLANGVVVHNCGLSTLMALMFFWRMIFFSKEWGVIISKDGKSSTDVLDKIKENIKNIPFWLGIKITANNVKGLKFSNGSKIDSFARSRSSGRGTSPTFALLDEFAFYQTKTIAEGIISSIVPSIGKTGGDLFIVSTPNGTTGEGELYYKQVQDLKNTGGKDFASEAVLYDVQWWMCPDMDGVAPYKGYNKQLADYEKRDYWNHPEVKAEAENFFKPIAENPKENAWLAFQFKTSGEVKYRQEILQDFVVMGNSVFSKDTIEKIQKRVLNPIKEGDLGNRYWNGLWYWKLPENKHRYIIGSDVAKGSADDSSSVQVVDMDTGEQVAEYLGKVSTKELSKLINDIGHYYNEAYVYVECNSIGEAVFNELYYNYNYTNMYRMKKISKADRTQVFTGWMTTTKSRELVTDCFIDYMSDDDYWNDFYPHSQRLVDQMKTWIWSGGRPDHTSSSHDDDIMAMAILLYNLPKAKQQIDTSGVRKSFFIDESGKDMNLLSNEEEKYYDKHEVLDRQGYLDAEDKMRQLSGAPENYDVDPLQIYSWLIS